MKPEDAEAAASAIAADLKSQVVLLEQESTTDAIRYMKYDWKDGSYGSEVIRWVYGYESNDGWEACLGDTQAAEFFLITASTSQDKSKSKRSPKNNSTSFVLPVDRLKPPSIESLGRLLKLPGICTDSEWSEEQTYQSEPQATPANFFDLFQCKLWELDEVDRLLQQGVDPNQRLVDVDPGCYRELREMTALEDVISKLDQVQLQIQLTVEKLLKGGADPNRLGTIQTPLADAVDTGLAQLVDVLLKGGAHVDIQHDRDGDCDMKELLRSAPTKRIEQSLKSAATNEAPTRTASKPPGKQSKR